MKNKINKEKLLVKDSLSFWKDNIHRRKDKKFNFKKASIKRIPFFLLKNNWRAPYNAHKFGKKKNSFRWLNTYKNKKSWGSVKRRKKKGIVSFNSWKKVNFYPRFNVKAMNKRERQQKRQIKQLTKQLIHLPPFRRSWKVSIKNRSRELLSKLIFPPLKKKIYNKKFIKQKGKNYDKKFRSKKKKILRTMREKLLMIHYFPVPLFKKNWALIYKAAAPKSQLDAKHKGLKKFRKNFKLNEFNDLLPKFGRINKKIHLKLLKKLLISFKKRKRLSIKGMKKNAYSLRTFNFFKFFKKYQWKVRHFRPWGFKSKIFQRWLFLYRFKQDKNLHRVYSRSLKMSYSRIRFFYLFDIFIFWFYFFYKKIEYFLFTFFSELWFNIYFNLLNPTKAYTNLVINFITKAKSLTTFTYYYFSNNLQLSTVYFFYTRWKLRNIRNKFFKFYGISSRPHLKMLCLFWNKYVDKRKRLEQPIKDLFYPPKKRSWRKFFRPWWKRKGLGFFLRKKYLRVRFSHQYGKRKWWKKKKGLVTISNFYLRSRLHNLKLNKLQLNKNVKKNIKKKKKKFLKSIMRRGRFAYRFSSLFFKSLKNKERRLKEKRKFYYILYFKYKDLKRKIKSLKERWREISGLSKKFENFREYIIAKKAIKYWLFYFRRQVIILRNLLIKRSLQKSKFKKYHKKIRKINFFFDLAYKKKKLRKLKFKIPFYSKFSYLYSQLFSKKLRFKKFKKLRRRIILRRKRSMLNRKKILIAVNFKKLTAKARREPLFSWYLPKKRFAS